MLSRRMKRDLDPSSLAQGAGSKLRKRWEPTYERIQYDTCVLTPEGMEGVSPPLTGTEEAGGAKQKSKLTIAELSRLRRAAFLRSRRLPSPEPD